MKNNLNNFVITIQKNKLENHYNNYILWLIKIVVTHLIDDKCRPSGAKAEFFPWAMPRNVL